MYFSQSNKLKNKELPTHTKPRFCYCFLSINKNKRIPIEKTNLTKATFDLLRAAGQRSGLLGLLDLDAVVEESGHVDLDGDGVAAQVVQVLLQLLDLRVRLHQLRLQQRHGLLVAVLHHGTGTDPQEHLLAAGVNLQDAIEEGKKRLSGKLSDVSIVPWRRHKWYHKGYS